MSKADQTGIVRGGHFLLGVQSGTLMDIGFGDGLPSMIPIVGNWDGKGKSRPCLYDKEKALFYFGDQFGATKDKLHFGVGGKEAIPFLADCDNSNWDRPVLFFPDSRAFHFGDHAGSTVRTVTVESLSPSCVPLVGNWTGEGDTPAYYEPETGTFAFFDATGRLIEKLMFGNPYHGTPILGDWHGDGTDKPGLYSSQAGRFFLANRDGSTYQDFLFGNAGDRFPIVGKWAPEEKTVEVAIENVSSFDTIPRSSGKEYIRNGFDVPIKIVAEKLALPTEVVLQPGQDTTMEVKDPKMELPVLLEIFLPGNPPTYNPKSLILPSVAEVRKGPAESSDLRVAYTISEGGFSANLV